MKTSSAPSSERNEFAQGSALGLVCALFILVGLVVVADPFWLMGTPDVRGLNALKPNVIDFVRQIKPIVVAREKPEALILGASTAENGLNPAHLGYERAYNFALPGASMYEIYMSYLHALHSTDVKLAILTVDYATYRFVKKSRARAFDGSYFAITDDGQIRPESQRSGRIDLAADERYLSSVWDTLRRQNPSMYNPDIPIHASHLYRRDGQRDHGSAARYSHYLASNESIFSKSLNSLAKHLRAGSSNDPFPVIDGGPAKFELLRRIIRLSYEHDVRLILFFPPCHAHLLEMISRLGDLSTLQDLKMRVLAQIENVAVEKNAAPFELWDFCGYSPYTTELITEHGARGARMKYFFDAQHYSTQMGDVVLKRMLKGPPEDVDFGVRIGSEDDLTKFFEQQATARADYLKNNPQEVKWVERTLSTGP